MTRQSNKKIPGEIEALLHDVREELRYIVEEIKDHAVCMLDYEGNVASWNKNAVRLFGYSTKHIIGKHVSVLFSENSRTKRTPWQYLEEVQEKRRIVKDEVLVRKNRRRLEAQITLIALGGSQKVHRGFLLIIHDVEEDRQVQDALRQYTEDLRTAKEVMEQEKAKDHVLLRSIGEGVIATDEKGKVILLNRQAENMLGLKESDCRGQLLSRVVRLEDEQGNLVPFDERPVVRAIETGKEVIDYKSYYVTPYIKRFPAAVVAAPVLIGKRIVGVVTVVRNISREKEIDRAKSEFVSLVSHQLRTPLTAIKLFSEMLESEALGSINTEQRELIHNIAESNEKMIQLVDTLLNVSRMETGKMKIEYKKLNLQEFITDVAQESRPLADSRNCEIVFHFPKTPIFAETDPVLLRQVLNNLISNALYYSPANSPVAITLSRKGRKYEVCVEDQGIGIAREDQHRIFERFYRADNAIKAKTEGNGLGLYMCRMISQALGGDIRVESEPGQGTLFCILMPTKPNAKERNEGK